MKQIVKLFFISCFFQLLIVHHSFAQEGYEHLSAFAHGAGRTYAITSEGLSAVGLNPALLQYSSYPSDYYKKNPTLTFGIIPFSAFGVDAGPSFIDAASLASVFKPSGGTISDEDRKKISNLLLDEKLSGRADVEILGASYAVPNLGTLALTWTTHAALRTEIPASFLNFFIHAESQLAQYPGSYSNFDFQGMWYNEYALSFAHQFTVLENFFGDGDHPQSAPKPVHYIKLGAALKYVSGTAYIGLDRDNYFANGVGSGKAIINVNYKIRSAYGSAFDPNKLPTSFSFGFITSDQAGSGFGADFGGSIEVLLDKTGSDPLFTFGASVTDLGFINWSVNATERVADHIIDTIYYDNVIGDIKHLNDSLKVLSGKLTHLNSFTTPLPTMLRIGAKMDLRRADMNIDYFHKSYLAIEFDDGLNSVVGSLNHPRIGIGITGEHENTIASLRVAAGFFIQSGQSDVTLGLGTTLFDHVMLDVSTAHLLQFFIAGTGRTDVAFALRGRF